MDSSRHSGVFSSRCSSECSIRASVVKKASSVAMLGAIMPAPFAMPPTRTVSPSSVNSAKASFGRVSVVMIARAASPPAPAESAGASAATPAG